MQYYARLSDGVVLEVFEIEDGIDFSDRFPGLEQQCVPCGPDVEQGWVLDGETLVPPAPTVLSKEVLISCAANIRWRKEIAGIQVGGAHVSTDRESQGMISRAYNLALVDPDELVDYKAESGWIELDSDTIIAIAVAVGRHVRNLFRTEKMICDQIEAGEITTFAEIEAAFS